jgi:hypothetical protein
VADVLVARGFSLLARTAVSSEAVETIRRFARDETNRYIERPDSDHADRVLEADVFELGIVAGVTATGAHRPVGTHEIAATLAVSVDDDSNGETAEFTRSTARLRASTWRTVTNAATDAFDTPSTVENGGLGTRDSQSIHNERV